MRFWLAIFITLLICFAPGYAQTDTSFVCGTEQEDVGNVRELTSTTWTLKVLLVEFSDVKHRNPTDHGQSAYTFNDWNDLFFSAGEYVSPNMYGPDGKRVYGSMRDYFRIISDGNFTLTGYVLNNDANEDNIPDWIVLPNTKSHYNNGSMSGFRSAAKSAANAAGLNVSTSSTVKLVIIYAGQMYTDFGGLNPHANGIGGTEYIMSERYNRFGPKNDEDEDAVFCGIGVHAHEFGHLLGWYDANSNTWELMNGGLWLPLIGSINSDEKSCSCPLPPTPYDRWKKGWVSFTTLTSDQQFEADYNLKDPEVFKIEDSNDESRYFLIECRHAHGTMTLGETTAYDYNHFAPWNLWGTRSDLQDVWLMVYAIKKYTPSTLRATLIQADGFNTGGVNRNMLFGYLSQTYWGDSGDIFPGLYDVRVLSPWSFPASMDGAYAPSTRPTTNVGFEIISVEDDYMVVDFYAEHPEDASPARPFNLTAQPTCYQCEVELEWDANTEPDIDKYKIYRKEVTDGGGTTGYEYVASVNHPTTSYIDYESVTDVGNRTLYYKITAVDEDQNESTYSNEASIYAKIPRITLFGESHQIRELQLLDNFPNPFNPNTIIRFGLPQDQRISLKIYSIIGEEVSTLADGYVEKGYHELAWDGKNNAGKNVASGLYFYTLRAGDRVLVKKMMLVR